MSDKLIVYLSSPFMEFEDTRKKFLDEIKARTYLYEINAMEHYRAENKNALAKCIQDVKECNIYVCILGNSYGSMAKDMNNTDTGKSYTHWEYITALERKNAIKRFVLLQRVAATDNNLKCWQDEIKASPDLMVLYYEQQEQIPQLIIESLDNYSRDLIAENRKKKDVLQEKIYLCDRYPQNQEFTISFDDDPVQFFLLNGHDKDLLHYFIRRKEIEYEERELQWKNIDIRPAIPNDSSAFDKVELNVTAEIFNKLKWKKFTKPKDITIDSLTEYMTSYNIDYLSVSWFIESIYWKNNKLNEFIDAFYTKYDKINKELLARTPVTPKRIIFFGILSYVDNPDISEEEFNKRVKSIKWEHSLSPFQKIKKKEVKDWLVESEIEDMDYPCEQLINSYLKEIYERDMYFSEVEAGLLNIIKLYKEENL